MAETKNQHPIRLVLVDDHEFARAAVAASLETETGLQIVGQAASVAEARSVIQAADPDVAVLDLRLPDGSGADLVEFFADARPELACVIYTSSLEQAQAAKLLEAGASAVLLKTLRGTDLVDTIRDLASQRSNSQPG